jgi:hypothetical protein
MTTGYIRKMIHSTWLANVVMIKKSNDKWQMCVDFTNLNKVCPKYSYLLPKIDCLVYNTACFEYLSFLDTNFGYHQIPMHYDDEEKTTFIIKEGTYCYRAMPFIPKNTRATYQ